jgi:hypothetical protein
MSTATRQSVPGVIAAIGIAGLLCLLLFVEVPGKGLWREVLLNAAHGPIFAVVAVLLFTFLSARTRVRNLAFFTAFIATVSLGILIEVLQSLAGRPGSIYDVMTNAAGAAAGLALWSLARRRPSDAVPRQHGARAWVPIAVALAGILFVAWPPLQAARAYVNRAAVFPTIVEFRRPGDLSFVTTEGSAAEIVDLPAPWAQGNDERALRIPYDEQHNAAMRILEPQADWRGYSVVAADITNPAERDLELTFRIFDATHDGNPADRLNLPLVIAPHTRTTIRVALAAVEAAPEGRSMDLARIADVMLFGREAQPAAEFYLSRIWLE